MCTADAATDIVVDLQGYLAQFSPSTDGRILDTRSGARPTGGSFHPLVGTLVNAAFVSVTVTETGGPGYIQLMPCDTPPGAT